MNKNKIVPIILLLFCSSVNLFAQESGAAGAFVLSGKITGRDTGKLILDYTDYRGNGVSDTATLRLGEFVFKGTVEGPDRASLRGDVKSRSGDDLNYIEIFLAAGKMTIVVSENAFKDAVITGSVMQADMDLLKHQKQANIRAEYAIGLTITRAYDERSKGGDAKVLNNKIDSLHQIYFRYAAQDKLTDYAFITAHPASYLSPYLMEYYFGSRKLPLDSAEAFYNSFAAAVKSSPSGKRINEAITSRKASAIGMPAPLFEKVDITGKELDLASFKGKNYVLLDFWASWCVPCQEGVPHLKKIYQKYHPKGLEIVSLSWDSKDDAWKDAIAKDSIGIWRHVLANMYLPNDNSLRDKYSVEGIPTLVLIGKNGVILDRWTGEDAATDDEIDKKMTEVFPK